jgi:WD40 repeat protein
MKPLKLQRCYELAFSSTGSLLVTLSRDVVAWDVQRRTKQFRVHPFSHPSHCSIHPEETAIVVKNTTGQIALIAPQDGALVRMLDATKENEGSNIMYSRCGEYVVDGSWGGQLTVRSATTGNISFQKVFPGEMIKRITRTVRGDKWFVVHQPKAVAHDIPPAPAYISVWSWPFTSPADILTSPESKIDTVAVSPDETRICLIGYDSISIIRLADNQFVASAQYTYSGTQVVARCSPDSQEIATVQRDSFVFYAASAMEKRQTIELQYASDIAYAPDGRLLALGSWSSGMLMERSLTPII